MIQISFRQFAPPGKIFRPDAFDGSVHSTIPFKMEETTVQATVLAVRVSESGRSAEITVKLPVTFPALLDGIPVQEVDG